MISTTLLQATSLGLTAFAGAFGAAFATFAAAFGISKIGSHAMDAIARQPEVANDVRMSMIIACALIEGTSLFAIVVCFMSL
ncbi:MAG TPA: F0F1 ATP synthase subunit C [Porphyromonadaceae bacterium]|nr:F0F1 ATP synthase subunit C [Porphyromonadaceae bacterium]